MKRQALETLSNEALCKLRDEVAEVLNSRAQALQRQIDQLIGHSSHGELTKINYSSKGKTVAPKYRGPNGEMWSGRGLAPRWLAAAMKNGKKREDFLIEQNRQGRG